MTSLEKHYIKRNYGLLRRFYNNKLDKALNGLDEISNNLN